MTKKTRIIVIIAAIALICGGYYFTLQSGHKQQLASAMSFDSSTTSNIGGNFELTDQNGKKFSDKDLKGKKRLMFFGFTTCPDVCPVTMAVMTEVMNQLETEGVKNVQPVFITIDPKHDTPAVLKAYLKDYYPAFVALTGPEDKVETLEKDYKVFASKDGKNISHSDLIYYMDSEGNYLSHFNRDNAPEDIVDFISSH